MLEIAQPAARRRDGIIGQTYLNVEFLGEAGHAGTVPMPMRRDALAGAAEAMLLGERIARDTKGEVVATVGPLAVSPGATNVIPGNVVVIVRHPLRLGGGAARNSSSRLQGRLPRDRRQAPPRPDHHDDARGRDHAVRSGRAADAWRTPTARVGGEPLRLGSGAGHDGQAMAKLCPIGMLFVRCRGGISHNPMEYAGPARHGHGGRGVDRLHRTV